MKTHHVWDDIVCWHCHEHITKHTKEELMEFLNSLSSKQFQKIQEFFDTMPKLRYKSQWSCPNCGKEDEKIIEGLNSFFELA